MNLTDEQSHCVQQALTGNTIAIKAYAGAGKSSTLRAIAEAMPNKRMLYLAFNKAIADDAALKFPSNVTCQTAHSLAYRAVGYKYKARLQGKLVSTVVLPKLELPSKTDKRIALLAMRCVSDFCKSGDTLISDHHVDRNLLMVVLKHSTDDILLASANKYVIHCANKLFSLLQSDESLPVTHDFYLKEYQLSNYPLQYDVILADECQDLSPVVIDLLKTCNSQVIYVGDSYQEIYAWRGAVNVLSLLANDIPISYLTRSFRFGDAIATLANKVLLDDIPLIGNNITSIVGNADYYDAVICRTNFGVISEVMVCHANSQPCYVQGGTKEIIWLLSEVMNLMSKGSSSHPELQGYDSWSEVLTAVDEDTCDQSIKSLVALTKKYTGRLSYVITVLRKTMTLPSQGVTTVTTAHKSKGLEWQSVRLSDDFKSIYGADGLIKEERNILYVAITRAVKFLSADITAIHELNA